MKEGLRAVGYGRVSTEEQEKSGTSLRDQFAGNHRKAKEHGAVMVAYFEDADSGGFYLTRKGLQDALKALESGLANALICKDFVRLTRNDRAEQALILKRIKEAGAELIFWDVQYENSPLGEFSLNVTGDFAILEKAVIKDRTNRGRRRRALEGVMPIATPPFGYYIPTKADVIRGTYTADQVGKYVLNPVTAPIAEGLFNRRAAGESLGALCRWLQSIGVPTTQGGEYWLASNVREIINNPCYYGLAAFGRYKTVTDESRKLRGYKRAAYKVAVPEADWIRIPCPAIVSRALWDRCKEATEQNREKLSTRVDNRRMLTGLLRCDRCKRSMMERRNHRNKIAYYMCKDYYPGANAGGYVCTTKHYRCDIVDALTIEAVKKVIHFPACIELAYQAYHAEIHSEYSEQAYQNLKRELSTLAKEEMATAQAQVRGIAAGANTTVYESMLRDLALKRTSLQNRLADYDRARSDVQSSGDRVTLIREALEDVETVLDAPVTIIPDHEKNAVLLKVIDHIYLNGDGYTITFKSFDDVTQVIAEVAPGQEPVIQVV